MLIGDEIPFVNYNYRRCGEQLLAMASPYKRLFEARVRRVLGNDLRKMLCSRAEIKRSYRRAQGCKIAACESAAVGDHEDPVSRRPRGIRTVKELARSYMW
jgi:hypothetical protein